MEAVTPLRAYSGNGLTWSKAIQVKYFDIFAGEEKITEILTVPIHLKELAVGYLYANGYIEDIGSIEKIVVEEDRIYVGLTPDYEFKMSYLKSKEIKPLETIDIKPVSNGWKIHKDKIFEKLGKAYSEASELPFALISDSNGYFHLSEDVSPLNTFYKVVGKAAIDHFDLRESFIILSEFLTPEIVIMGAYLGIPILGTLKLPTDLAVTVAEGLGITLFAVTFDGINVFTHPARIQ